MSPGDDRSLVQRLYDAVPRASTAGSASLLGLVIGGPAGALVAGATPAVADAVLDAMQRRSARGAIVVDTAAQQANLSLDELLARLEDAERRELLLRVIEAAGGASFAERLRALARVLANAATDDARVDEALILAPALADLEATHVQVLALVDGAPPDAQGSWDVDAIAQRLPHAALVLPAVVQTLIRHGLLREPPHSAWIGRGENPLTVTDLGRRCIELLGGQPPVPVSEAGREPR